MQGETEIISTVTKSLDILKYVAGALVVIVVWVWKASKDHSKVAILRSDHDSLKDRVDTIDDRLDEFITFDQHSLMQKQCQDHIAKEQSDKINAAVLAMISDNAVIREDMAVMNANICRLMGRFDVEPVPTKEKKRRTDIAAPQTL